MYILVNVVNIAFSIIEILFESISTRPIVFARHIVVFVANTRRCYLSVAPQKSNIYTPDAEDTRALT